MHSDSHEVRCFKTPGTPGALWAENVCILWAANRIYHLLVFAERCSQPTLRRLPESPNRNQCKLVCFLSDSFFSRIGPKLGRSRMGSVLSELALRPNRPNGILCQVCPNCMLARIARIDCMPESILKRSKQAPECPNQLQCPNWVLPRSIVSNTFFRIGPQGVHWNPTRIGLY